MDHLQNKMLVSEGLHQLLGLVLAKAGCCLVAQQLLDELLKRLVPVAVEMVMMLMP